jgi:hypothetical protein
LGEIFGAYSDESGTFNQRYQTIAVVSGHESALSQLRSNLKEILDKHEISEVKFVDVRSHSPKVEAATGFARYAVEFARQTKIRIDVLVWDIQDSRHTIQGRDDIANLERMYYKVLIHAGRQWNQIDWDFCPDEHSSVNWNEIAEFLNRTRLSHPKPALLTLFESEEANQLFQLKSVKEMKSHQEPLIQLADLFAGMARFTREKGEQCIRWLDSQENKEQISLPLFPNENDEVDEVNRTEQNRFHLIGEFNGLCKRYTLGISLRSKKYLWTPNSTNSINFWSYEPQHEYDKAPTSP